MNEPQNEPQQPYNPAQPQQPLQPQQPAQPYMPQQPQQPVVDSAAQSVAAPAFETAPQAAPQPAAQPAPQPAFQSAAQPAPQPAQPSLPQQPYMPQQPYDPAQPQQAPYGGYQSYLSPEPPKNGKATGALVCGILSIVTALFIPLVGSVLGIVLGIVAIVLAGGAVRQMGMKTGRTKAGKTCGIIGMILAVLALLLYLAVGCMAGFLYGELEESGAIADIEAVIEEEISSSGSASSNAAPDDAPGGYATSDPEKAQVAALVSERFDTIAPITDENLQLVANLADEGLTSQMEYSMADLGIDPLDYARWITQDVTYTVDVVVVDEAEGTGWVGVDVTARDVFAFLDNFDVLVGAFMESEEYAAMESEQEALIALGNLFYQAMDETTEFTEDYAMIDVVYENGTWVIDEESWMFELDWLFGLV